MIKSILGLLVSLLGLPAWAYTEGTFNCKNTEGLPNNVYEVRTLKVDGVDVPHVTVTRYHKGPMVDGAITTTKSVVKGLATSAELSNGTQTLLLGAMRIDFVDGKIYNCKTP